ncbi:hypothetical protein Tco_0825928 [Tanacetum coccineum]
MRTASTAVKPCQENSLEFYLITSSIYTDQRGTMVFPMVAAARRGRVRFIAVCSYSTDNYKDIMKAQVHVSKTSATLIPFEFRTSERRISNFLVQGDLALAVEGELTIPFARRITNLCSRRRISNLAFEGELANWQLKAN